MKMTKKITEDLHKDVEDIFNIPDLTEEELDAEWNSMPLDVKRKTFMYLYCGTLKEYIETLREKEELKEKVVKVKNNLNIKEAADILEGKQ